MRSKLRWLLSVLGDPGNQPLPPVRGPLDGSWYGLPLFRTITAPLAVLPALFFTMLLPPLQALQVAPQLPVLPILLPCVYVLLTPRLSAYIYTENFTAKG
ncbi:MAG: hypothetical protein HXO74_02055 [Scardovia wiggsiae]|nr:hypothetical protein [Scardovia wiggsiae]